MRKRTTGEEKLRPGEGGGVEPPRKPFWESRRPEVAKKVTSWRRTSQAEGMTGGG